MGPYMAKCYLSILFIDQFFKNSLLFLDPNTSYLQLGFFAHCLLVHFNLKFLNF
jgi:hypothetical protein